MKKILLGVCTIAVLASCNKEGKKIDKLANGDQKASYSFGVTLGQQAENVNGNLSVADSLNYDEVAKGIRDYLSGGKDRESYAYGQSLGQTIETVIIKQKLESKFDKDIIVQGLLDYAKNKKGLLIPQDSVNMILQKFATNHQQELTKNNLSESKKFIEAKKKESGAKTTASGLVYVVEKEGNGAKPTTNQIVSVKYTGKLMSGKVFDSTDKNSGKPVEFPVTAVIPGWTEGLQLMTVGSKYKFYISPELGYGEQGQPQAGIGPNDALEFEVELLGVKDAPKQEQPQPGQGGGQQLTPEQNKQIQEQMKKQGAGQ